MTVHPPHDPLRRDEDRLRGLLRHAVDDVEPDSRREQIRRLTAGTTDRKVTTMSPSPRRPWLYGALGAAAAVVAVVGITTAVHRTGGTAADPTSAGTRAPASSTASTGTSTPSAATSPTAGSSGDASGGTAAVAVYYVGDAPGGPRLFREFHRADPADAVAEVAQSPQDPDYRTDWHAGDVVSSRSLGSTIQVTLGSLDLRSRPAGMSAAEARIAVQSLVYTAQAAYQTRAGVQFVVGNDPMPSLYGVPLSGAVAAGSTFDTLSLMSITAPAEGQAVSGTLTASGVSNGPEANVIWQLKQGDRVVRKGFTTAAGFMGDQLYPWRTTVPLAGVPAGTYTFVAMTEDPSGGQEGHGAATDTRTVVVG